MANIFRYTPVTYFQTPESLIETGVWAQLVPSAKDLYMLLLYRAQKTSKQVVNLTATDAKAVGISVNVVKGARENLVRHNLITATKKRDGYSYEILNPVTGQPLHRIEDLSKVPAEIVGQYFLDLLSEYDPKEVHEGTSIHSHCPFHESMKNREHPLHVTFDGGGAYNCHQCGARGGIVDFTIAMAEKHGEVLDQNRGYSRVRESLVTAARRYEKREAERIARARAMM
jgi:hypothetical protein